MQSATGRVGSKYFAFEFKAHVATVLTDRVFVAAGQFWPSLRRVWLSPTFWAVLLLHAGNAWGSNATLTAIPLLCHYVFKLGVPATAAWMASMYAGRTVFGLLFGQVVERVMAAKWMGKTTLRKLSCVFCECIIFNLSESLVFPLCSEFPC